MQIDNLVVKWGTSRDRDSYGCTLCTLYVNGNKVAACNGGGYDMEGTVFGIWIAKEFASRLLKLKKEFYGLTFHDPDFDPGKVVLNTDDELMKGKAGETVEEREAAGESLGLERYQQFYRASSKTPTKNHRIPLLDGACGTSCMFDVLRAIGGEVRSVYSNKKECIYTVTMSTRMPSQKEKPCQTT